MSSGERDPQDQAVSGLVAPTDFARTGFLRQAVIHIFGKYPERTADLRLSNSKGFGISLITTAGVNPPAEYVVFQAKKADIDVFGYANTQRGTGAYTVKKSGLIIVTDSVVRVRDGERNKIHDIDFASPAETNTEASRQRMATIEADFDVIEGLAAMGQTSSYLLPKIKPHFPQEFL